jgi:hypothetical protein
MACPSPKLFDEPVFSAEILECTTDPSNKEAAAAAFTVRQVGFLFPRQMLLAPHGWDVDAALMV